MLRGMGLSHLAKNEAAIKVLADKGMAPADTVTGTLKPVER